jgi:2,4-didehydro-3-deoxy-L-rhamnonate hydrolase
MRLLNVNGRAALERGGKAIDIEKASAGVFGANIASIYGDWEALRAWERGYVGEGEAYAPEDLGPPVIAPAQLFAIGLNYREHAAESGIEPPDTPMVFTKFATAITGPYDTIVMPTATVDWEAELVAVVGRHAAGIAASKAWDYIAGLTIGQDLSERTLQVKPPFPQQFSLAKSFPGFAPLGPALVTPDEFGDPTDLEIGCRVGNDVVQSSRTGDLIFGVPALVEYLSSIVPLLPGDVIFTGTPSGVGFARTPQRFLSDGDELVTWIEGIGTMTQRFTSAGISQ